MKIRELRELGPEELRNREREIQDEIFRLRMKRAATSLDNKMLIRNSRRELARVKTFLRQKTERTGR